MRVTKVESFLSGATWRNYTFVKITTDEGIVGWGEGLLGWKEYSVHETALRLGRRYVVGKSPFDIEDMWVKIYQIEHNAGPVMYSAMAGIETALWDIAGKACGQPGYNLVGGKVRSKVKAYANGWESSTGDAGKVGEKGG